MKWPTQPRRRECGAGWDAEPNRTAHPVVRARPGWQSESCAGCVEPSIGRPSHRVTRRLADSLWVRRTKKQFRRAETHFLWVHGFGQGRKPGSNRPRKRASNPRSAVRPCRTAVCPRPKGVSGGRSSCSRMGSHAPISDSAGWQLPAASYPLPPSSRFELPASRRQFHFALRAFVGSSASHSTSRAFATRDPDPGSHTSPLAISFERLQPRSELFIPTVRRAVWSVRPQHAAVRRSR